METSKELPKNKKDITYLNTVNDDELRPWVTNHSWDAKIDEKISELNMMLSITAPQKKAGARGESELDRMPDSMILFAEMAENEDWMIEDNEEGEEGEGIEADNDDNPESQQPLEDDPEVIALTEHLNKLNREIDEASGTPALLRPITRKEHEYMKQRMLNLARHRKSKKKRVRAAAYMPSLHSRIYKEWADTQATQRSRSDIWRRDEENPERPPTAFITSFLEQQGVIPGLGNSLLPLTQRPATSSGRISTGQVDTGTTSQAYDLLSMEQSDRLRSPGSRSLAPIAERPPSSPVSVQHPHPRAHTGPSRGRLPPASNTSSEQFETCKSNTLAPCSSAPSQLDLPIRPSTSAGAGQSTPSSRPVTSRKLSSRGGALSSPLEAPPVVFPSSNTDTIPSSNSAIVKYKSSRDQMLDSLNLPSKEQRARAYKRAAERMRVQHENGNSTTSSQTRDGSANGYSRLDDTVPPKSDRFDDKANMKSLTKIGITATAGTVAATSTIYRKPRMRAVRSIMDQMKTTSGSFQMYANEECHLKGLTDPKVRIQETRAEALRSKASCEEDHAKSLLTLAGFFETVGAETFYMSETHKFFKDDPQFLAAVRNREQAHVTQADHVREWANHALTDGRKLFHNNGGGFAV